MVGNKSEILLEDIRIVNSILGGNADDFNAIVSKYEIMVLRFVYNMIKQKEAAEDITQEVFITIYNKLYMYDKKHSFSNWILQISKNKCIDYIRKYKKVYESNIDDAYDISSKEMLPQDVAEYNEVKKNIEEYIKTLEDVDKQVLILRYSENLTFTDIAEILGLTESTAKRKYYKIRENFRNQYKD